MKAVIFDFDGTILDTERTELAAWQFIYNEYGCEMPLIEWHKRIGSDPNNFDPLEYLEKITRTSIDHELVTKRRRSKLNELITDLYPLPGIINWISTARDLGMRLAIASSSPRYWIENHLNRIDLINNFDSISTKEDVKLHKPNPEVYELTLKKLGIASDEAIAIEDSPSGATAALAAGIKCIVVPNELTNSLYFPRVFKIVQSLEEVTLHEILKSFQ
jgi:HAD superfamily hydrolase (TIGR01509 family)